MLHLLSIVQYDFSMLETREIFMMIIFSLHIITLLKRMKEEKEREWVNE